ncbi:MAG TPA: hypothetical protein VFH63_04465 [candidate division Zixibacteria bacterium]|nr:hypothetical protein [candidate division Zixibacteria bacterium]
MPDLLRRVAALAVISALGIALLLPLTARSATPSSEAVDRLLDAADRASLSTLDRGSLQGRNQPATLTLMERGTTIGPESLSTTALPTPASAPMQAKLYANPTPRPTPRPAPPVPPPQPNGDTVTGKATWYCCTAGYRGQAVVALPGALGGRYDPPPAARSVTVCADRCVVLPVVDYCGCHWGTANQKVADLSPEAWAAVSDAPTSRGVITVTIRL